MIPGDPGISPTTYNKDWNNFAPRIGFAWLPFGPSSKTSVRAAYGMFYNTERGYLLNETQLNQPFVLNVSIPNPPSFENPWANYPGGNPYPFTAPTTNQQRAAVPVLTANAHLALFRSFCGDSLQPAVEFHASTRVAGGGRGFGGVCGFERNQAVAEPGSQSGGVHPRCQDDGKALSTGGNIDSRRLNRSYQGIDKAYY